jgi:hypothetical protein
MVTDVQVDKALELAGKGAGNYEYFFSKLGSPAWIEPLSRRGRFGHPPPAERIENLVRFPRWPEGEYLLRMAPFAPNEVAAAIEPICFESDNPLVHQLLLEIASSLPPALAKGIAVEETAWVKRQTTLFTLYPEKAAALVVHLAQNGEPSAALRLASAVLEMRELDPQQDDNAAAGNDEGSEVWKPSPVPIGKIEPIWLQMFLQRITEPLSLAIPDDFLKALAANLDRAVTIRYGERRDNTSDYSTIWRTQLAHSAHYEALDICVSGVTEAIKFLGGQEVDYSERIMAVLAFYGWPIFDRLRAFTYLEAAHPDPESVGKFLSVRERFRNSSENPEFIELLRKWATSLPMETIERILRIVDAGPEPASYAYHLEHRVRPEDAEAVKESIIDQWRLGWLQPLAAALDEPRTEELNLLSQKYGAPQPRFRSGFMQVTDHSPTDLAAFKGLSIEELLNYLKAWVPPSPGFPFEEPSYAGMGNTLREWVADDPQHASEALGVFLTDEIHPTYLTAVLDAFSAALKTEKPFDVYAVARAVKWVAKNTNPFEEAKSDAWLEATWNWAHMSAARFMTDLFLHEERLDVARASELFPAVEALCFLPRPTEEDEVEYKKEPDGHVPLALNSPRPTGVEALIRYGRWLKTATPESEFTSAQLRPVFDLLEQKLDPEKERSAAVREMFGMQFRTLAWLDVDWFITVIPKLFPGKAERVLDRFGWNAYLRYSGPVTATLSAMRNRYEAAVRALPKKDEEVSDLDRALASHLMQYYVHGGFELDDPLLALFFDSASIKLRAQAMGDIGWSLGQETAPLSPELQARLMRLWESRMPLLQAGSKTDADELGVFGWWLASKKFPDEWAVHQAMQVLERVRSLRPDFAAVEAFAALAPIFPYEAVRVVHVLFEEDRDGWAIHGWSQHLHNILVEALNDGENARQEAKRMIERLVSKGHREYRNLSAGADNAG